MYDEFGFLIVCGAMLMLGVVLGSFLDPYGSYKTPVAFLETIGEEKCAETNQTLERFDKEIDDVSGRYIMVFTCEGDNPDKYDSIEVRR